MRNRFTSIVLTLALCGSLLSATASAEEANRAFAPDQPVPAVSQDSASIEAPAETAPVVPEIPAEDPEGTVSYENLEKRMRENNPTVRMLQENIEIINEIDYDELYDDLRKRMAEIAKAQWIMKDVGPDADAIRDYLGIEYDSYTYHTMDSAYDSLRDTFEDLKDGQLQKDNELAKQQLENTQYQVIMGAETLYIAILEMQNSRAGLQRQLDALDRSLAEMEIRQKYGQVSALTLHQVQNGRTQLASGIATLDMNISNYTCQLEVMLGLAPSGTLQLTELPEISNTQITEMQTLDDALALTKEKSYELYEADQTLEDAKEKFRADKSASGGLQSTAYKSAVRTYDAAKFTHQATIQNFELSFRTMYTAVANYRQVLDAAESALEYQRSNCAATELKYQHGTISKNTLLEAQDALATAETDVLTAKHNLFTAYHNYQLAVDRGILN